MTSPTLDSETMVPKGMHRCLRIADIQMEIFSHLPRTTCGTLARTCTSFFEQAMDVVWAEVPMFASFVRCIQSETLSTQVDIEPGCPSNHKYTLDFRREPQLEDWRQFCKHAHRVKIFTDRIHSEEITHDKPYTKVTYELTPSVMITITRFLCENAAQDSDYHLFPKLRTLHVRSIVDQCWVPKYLPYLSRNTLRYVAIEYGLGRVPENMDYDSHVGWVEAMPLIRSAWPHLHKITFDEPISVSGPEGQKIEPYSQVLGPWFRTLACLRRIKATLAAHPLLFSALSELPLLREINLEEEDLPKHHYTTLTTKPPPLSLSCFHSLAKIEICDHTSTFDTIVSLFQGLGQSEATKLHIIDLDLYDIPSTPHSAAQFHSLFEAISHISRVRSLRIHAYTERSGPDSSSQSELILSGKLLSTLFPLHCMRRLNLIGQLDVTVEDQDLHGASVAWPELRSIHLPMPSEVNTGVLSRPRVTLVGVQALYEGCPRLRDLFIGIDYTLSTIDRSDRAILDIPLACSKSRKVSVDNLFLSFLPPGPSSEPCYRDLDPAQCLAIAIRLMLPMVNYVAICCPSDRRWEQHLCSSVHLYRSMEQTKVSAMWRRLLLEGNSDNYEY